MMTKLPAALRPPTFPLPGLPLTACGSLTLATLRSIEDKVPFYLSVAADISTYRAHFAGIPGVLVVNSRGMVVP